jgi:hypothetical protein
MREILMRKRSKFYNKKFEHNGLKFDSKFEAQRYETLLLLQKCGEIEKLIAHPTFEVSEGFTDAYGKKYKPIYYEPDFIYVEKRSQLTIVEDTKGMKTEGYQMKKKLFLKKYPDFIFREITR